MTQVTQHRYGQVDPMAITWCDGAAFTMGVFHMLERKSVIALRRHQLDAVTHLEAVLH